MLAVAVLIAVVIAAVSWLLRGEVLHWVEYFIAGATGATVYSLPSVSPFSLDIPRYIPDELVVALHGVRSLKQSESATPNKCRGMCLLGGRGQPNKWLQGNYGPVDKEITAKDLAVDGVLPPALDGAFVRNGPNPLHKPVGGHHWYSCPSPCSPVAPCST